MTRGATGRVHLASQLLAIAACAIFVGCGGKASKDDTSSGGAATTSGGSTSSIGGGNSGMPATAPSTVSQTGSAVPATDATAKPECLYGFQGFQATLEGKAVDFKAFVSEPGDYTGDPLHILWLSVTTSDGGRYLASAGPSSSAGEISLHVDATAPRFAGKLTAVLPNEDDTAAEPLELQLTFDIAVRVGCM